MVDAGLALKAKGHQVHYFTNHHDTSHCFVETRNGNLHVSVYGDGLPRSILGKAYALCAYIRFLYLSVVFCIFYSHLYDVVIVDQISATIPFLRFFTNVILYF